MKIFLLIEPSILTIPLVFKAAERNDKIFIISKHMEPVASMKAALNASSLCFQVDTEDHGAVLHLVDKISKTFSIDAVIPGSFSSLPIASKVSSFLKKAGLSPEAIHQLSQENWMGPLQESLGNVVNVNLPENEYTIIGFSKNNAVHLLSIVEKLPSLPSQGEASGYILSPEVPYSIGLKPFITRIIEKLSLTYGPFEAKVKVSEKTLNLKEFKVELASSPIPELMEAAMGIDYYDNVLRFFSYENLLLYKKQILNAGSLSFNKPGYIRLLKQHPYLYSTSPSLEAVGYAILVHKNYETLRNEMIKLQLACSNGRAI